MRHDQSRFGSLLELTDLELIDAIGGQRRAELHAAYAEWQPAPSDQDQTTASALPPPRRIIHEAWATMR